MTLKPLLKHIKNFGIFLFAFIVTYLVSGLFSGFLIGLGGNIQAVGIDQIAFDPLITIAYIILYYFLSHFYELPEKPMFWLFILTLTLSFTTNFIQGSIILVILPPILKLIKVIPSSQSSQEE